MLKQTITRALQYLNSNRLLKQGLIDTNYYFLAQVGSRLIGLLIIPVFARLLSVEEFATYDLFILASSFLVLIGGLGLDSGVAIKIAENKDNREILFGLLFTCLAMNFGVLIMIWLLALAAGYAGLDFMRYNFFLINGLFIYTILYQFNYLVYNFIRWMGNAKIAALINFASYVLGICGGLLYMLLTEQSLNSFVLGAIVGNFVGSLLTAYQGRKYLKIKFLPAGQFKDLLRLSLPYVPTYLSNYLMQFVDRILITTYFGLATLGLYALVNRMGQVVTFSLQIISSGFRPVITANYSSAEGQALSRKIYRVYWLSTVPVAIVSVLLARFVVGLFGGEQYEMAVPVLPYIVLSVWFLGSFFLFGFGYQVKRKTIYVTLITLSVVGMVYGLSFPFMKLSGMLGIAQASLAASMVGSFVYIYFSERLFRFGYNLNWMLIMMATSVGALLLLQFGGL